MHVSLRLAVVCAVCATLAAATSDQVWLLNCINPSGDRHSELAVYPDFPDQYPDHTVTLKTEHNTTLSWEYANITQGLPGGSVFESLEFGLPSPEGSQLGFAKLGADHLTCTPYVIEALYTTSENSVCSSAFQCARSPSPPDTHSDQILKTQPPQAHPPPQTHSPQRVLGGALPSFEAQDATKVIWKVFDHKVVVNGKLVVGDIFWNVWDERDANYFSGRPRGFGTDGCTVTYTGHGDIDWATTNGLCTTLLTTAGVKNFLQYTSYKRKECSDTCDTPKGPKCCAYEFVTYWQTHIPSQMAFDVINVPPAGSGRNPSDQGTMSYSISCPPPPPGIGCFFCKILGDIFGAGSQTGGIGGASDELKAVAKGFGAATLLTSVACQIAGC